MYTFMNDAVKPPSPEGMKQFMKISCLKNDHIGNSPTADTVRSVPNVRVFIFQFLRFLKF